MGFLDDVKDSIPGKHADKSSGSADFNDDKFDSSFSSGDSGLGGSPGSGDGPSHNDSSEFGLDSSGQNSGASRPQRGNSGRHQNQGGRNRTSSKGPQNGQQPGQSGRGNNPQQSGRNGPAQSHGRNQAQNNLNSNRNHNQRHNAQGGSNQGNEFPNANAGRPQPGETEPQLSQQTQQKMEHAGFESSETDYSNDSVAGSMDDIDQIKSQNEQIIELLKRLNQTVNQLAGNQNHGNRR